MKNNLEHSAVPTSDEIKLYHEGKLGPMRSHEIELLAQENPLIAEALEGYAAKPAYAMLPLIQAGIIEASAGAAAATTASAGAGATLLKVASPWWHLNGWWIGVVAGTVAATGTAVIMNNSSDDQKENAAQSNQVVVAQNQTQQVIEQEGPIDTTMYIPSNISDNQIVDKPSMASQNESEGSISSEVADASRPSTEITSIASKGQQSIISEGAENDQTNAVTPKKSSTVAIGIIHVLNYKLADYTALRQENWQKFSLDDVGVSAQFKNEEERNKYYKDHPEQRIDYVDYVSQCVKAYDENKFTLAIDRFAEILKQYPDDVNALFYTGMSHYKLGSYSTAEDLFSKVEKNFIRTFNEEALFYHGKSLKKLNRIDEANTLFVKVVKWNGFYKEQAIEEMQSNE